MPSRNALSYFPALGLHLNVMKGLTSHKSPLRLVGHCTKSQIEVIKVSDPVGHLFLILSFVAQ